MPTRSINLRNRNGKPIAPVFMRSYERRKSAHALRNRIKIF